MRNKVAVIVFFFIFISSLKVKAQESIQQIIQIDELARQSEYNLFFIDFWATWCVPCVYAKEHLSVLQNQNKNKLFVLSLSNESTDKIDKHLLRHPSSLAVAVDYNNNTFTKYKIHSLPYGVLLNANGDVLWEGNPTKFKQSDIDYFNRRNTSKVTFDKLFQEQHEVVYHQTSQYVPKRDFEIKKYDTSTDEGFEAKVVNDFNYYKGSLKELLVYLLGIHESQLFISEKHNKNYQVYSKIDLNQHKTLDKVLKKLRLDIDKEVVEGKVLYLDFKKATLWDAGQIEWGNESPRYLIDDHQIQADNVTIKDLVYNLSRVLNIPVIGNFRDSNDLHDWQLQYKFFDLMKMELNDVFNIKADMQTKKYKQYRIN